jgi:hypothetical protein
MIEANRMKHNFKVRCVWLQDHSRQYYRPHFLAEITGPYVGDPTGWAVIGHTVPGAVSKLANLVRKAGKGKLLDQAGQPSWNAGIMGLNR